MGKKRRKTFNKKQRAEFIKSRIHKMNEAKLKNCPIKSLQVCENMIMTMPSTSECASGSEMVQHIREKSPLLLFNLDEQQFTTSTRNSLEKPMLESDRVKVSSPNSNNITEAEPDKCSSSDSGERRLAEATSNQNDVKFPEIKMNQQYNSNALNNVTRSANEGSPVGSGGEYDELALNNVTRSANEGSPVGSGGEYDELQTYIMTEDCVPNISGHRVIDISFFFKELIKAASHESLFQCGLNTMELTSEKLSGLSSKFLLSCLLCKKQFTISNSNNNLNKMAVEGILAAGCGKAQLNQLLAAVELPELTQHKYETTQDEIFDEWEVTAWEEMKKAGLREKEAAIKEGRFTKDGIPIIDVIVDGCWARRSYRTNYAALSGAACIIGRRFGQVLFLAVKNKYCCICSRAAKRNEIVRQHECFKNFNGPSTSMESAIIADGFKKSIEMHGVVYGRFIADGDSSTYARILSSRPYPSLTVEKIGCKNHILRNLCNKLQAIKTDTKFNIGERKSLTNVKIMSARKYIINAIKYHGNQEPRHESIKNLHADILISMHHAFGYHDNCNKNFCTAKNTTEFQIIYNTYLWQKINHIIQYTASQARSLIENIDSNIVESFNGVIAKLVGGKRINYAQKRSYQARCAAAVVSFNSGRLLSTVHSTLGNESHDTIKHFEDEVDKARRYNRSLKRKRNRKLTTQNTDFHYGENVDHPDMDPHTYELSKVTFLKNLEKTKEERREIERRTVLQSESGEWLELRRNLLTASNFGKVVKRRKTNSCANIVKNMLYRPNIDHVASITHGKKNEKPALEQLSRLLSLEIKDCGLFIDDKYPFLGATPDGITDDMVVEIKCPIAPFKMGIDAAIKEGKMHFWRINKRTGQIYINEKSDWYFQIQGQMHICKKERGLLAVWFGENKIKTEIITKDDKFWKEKMEPHLISFYYDCLLPELVDPRHTRNQSIRDPEYVLKRKLDMDVNKENLFVCTDDVQVENIGEGNVLEEITNEDDTDESFVIGFRNF